jgi:hypothetical protein
MHRPRFTRLWRGEGEFEGEAVNPQSEFRIPQSKADDEDDDEDEDDSCVCPGRLVPGLA